MRSKIVADVSQPGDFLSQLRHDYTTNSTLSISVRTCSPRASATPICGKLPNALRYQDKHVRGTYGPYGTQGASVYHQEWWLSYQDKYLDLPYKMGRLALSCSSNLVVLATRSAAVSWTTYQIPLMVRY